MYEVMRYWDEDRADWVTEEHDFAAAHFPELKAEVDRYLERCHAWRSGASRTRGSTEFRSADVEAARDQLNAAAQSLTTRIMGVAA
jgi:hypothetical protein